MAAKLLHSLADDNPDLQNQIGCTTGVFQVFDRRRVVTGRHPIRRRLPAGDFYFSDVSSEAESDNLYLQQAGHEGDGSAAESRRLSRESSRASCSSSYSSLSSMDFNRTVQPEGPTSARLYETNLRDSAIKQGRFSPHSGRRSHDLQDPVTGSVNKEARGIPIRAATRDELHSSVAKRQDSPRPSQLSKSVDGSLGVGINSKHKNPADIKESLRLLAKLREVPWLTESKEVSAPSYEAKNGGSLLSTSKDTPRLSYDGRERSRLSFESQDTTKSTSKLNELPRLSLDNREHSMRRPKPEPDYLLQNLEKGSSENSFDELSTLPRPSDSRKRTPSVVAKLMGLETLPASVSPKNTLSNSVESCMVEEKESVPKPLLTKELNWPNSLRNSLKDPVSPRWKSSDLVMKPVSSLRVPIEPAPWRHLDGNRSSQKPVSRHVRAPAREANSFPSVYSEIEKRLKDLEFKQSAKDLRALKQIIEAMQAKGFVESGKEEDEASNFNRHRDLETKYTSRGQKSTLANQSNMLNGHVTSSTARETNSLRVSGSPIVIMKPAKHAGKSGISTSSVTPLDDISGRNVQRERDVDSERSSVSSVKSKDEAPKASRRQSAVSSTDKKSSNRDAKTTQTSTRSQSLIKGNASSSAKSSGSASPRMQQKRNEMEKRSRPPIPPSTDSSKPRRQSNRRPRESSSPGGKFQIRSPNSQLSDDQLSEVSNESRSLSYQGDDMSLPSDSGCFLDSKMDIEVGSVGQSTESNCSLSPSMKALRHSVIDLMHKRLTERMVDDGPLAEPGTVGPEHTSPVSVLDVSVHRDDMPSPMKQIPDDLKDDGSVDTNIRDKEDQWNPEDGFSSADMGSGLSTEINNKKLKNIENLVQKLRRLNSSHDEANTDYIASLSDNTNRDHRYISEILLASGLLLRDLGSGLTTVQLHPSGQPINPELFLVLERTKASTHLAKEESSPEKIDSSNLEVKKYHRKLLFDVVNEMLAKKLALTGASTEPWLKPQKLAKKTLSAQKLLKELCIEIEQLQAKSSPKNLEEGEDKIKAILCEDVLQRTECWTDFCGEIPGVVLDVERLIFKDLIDEVVIGEAAGIRAKQGRRRRQLFAK